MPRPKVHHSQRQRAAEACNFCRDAKKRCSGTAPCNQCVQRGLDQSCFITYLPRGTRTRTAIAEAKAAYKGKAQSRTPPRISGPSRGSLEGTAAGGGGDFYPISPSDSRHSVPEAGMIRSEVSLEPVEASPGTIPTEADAGLTTNGPRMLRSNLGEPGEFNVFYAPR
jgi:Zn(2)-Cys(6) binuclear cluster domain-containing protein